MTKVIANDAFHEIKPSVTADERGRLSLGAGAKKRNYRVMVNEAGQILLDPIVNIPERELWLWKNPEALNSVRRGMEQAANGETRSLGSFAQYADLEIEDED